MSVSKIKRIKTIITLGPNTINKKFLAFANLNVDLLRLNMSHLSILQLTRNIKYVRKYSKIPICIDTEGAQIRTKVKKEKFYKLGEKIEISNTNKNFSLYPESVISQLRKNDILNIGFDNLNIEIVKIVNNILYSKVIAPGKLENNKGVHLENRKIKLNYLTQKDYKAIEIGKKQNIKYFALSFTNSLNDIINFNKILKNKEKIFKIETLEAVNNFHKLIRKGDNFLIDRGDLSKDVKLETTPIIQRYIFKVKKKYNRKKVFVATNLLESMINNSSPTRGEVNDIYNTLEMGANGLVLAAETAVGNHPKEAINFINKMINVYLKKNNFK
jgi:pyruvate kinase